MSCSFYIAVLTARDKCEAFVTATNSLTNSVGLISKKKNNFARAAHFFVHFFAVLLHDYNVKLGGKY